MTQADERFEAWWATLPFHDHGDPFKALCRRTWEAGVAAERARCAALVRATPVAGDYYTTPDGEEYYSESAGVTLDEIARRVEAG